MDPAAIVIMPRHRVSDRLLLSVLSPHSLFLLSLGLQLCYTTIEKLEEKIQEEEHNYDLVFTQYVKARGMNNVEVEYLEWISGDIVINLDTGEISYANKQTEDQPEPPKPSGAA